MTLTCNQLLQRHAQAWEGATVHPFLEQCKSGTIQPRQFNTWLVQDYLFVVEFTRALAHAVDAAPVQHFDVLLSGLSALKDELTWFKAKAAERQLDLDTSKQPTCTEYCDYLHGLGTQPYPVQATALWAIEFAYNQGWQQPGTMSAPYSEFSDRWGNPGFTDYVKCLEEQADQVLQTASPSVQDQAEAAFLRVAGLEKAFWQMAFSAEAG